ncbi:MAG TPA: Ig-like domain-containing protein [Verrucomicrobiae bacterium]
MNSPHYLVRASLRCLLILFAVLLLPLCGQAGTATVTANCRSIILDEFQGAAPGGTVYASVTTYDGSSGYPLGMSTTYPYTFNNSEELRPRSGSPGVYEADFGAYQSGLVAYGRFTLNLPTTDSDANGLPDISQKDKASNVSFTGSGYSDFSAAAGNGGAFSIQNGQLNRAANAQSGTFSYRSVEPLVTVYYSGTFRLSTASGSASYTRGTPNSITLTLTLNDGATTTPATASTTFTVVNANQITLPAFTLTAGGVPLAVQAMTLNRTGTKYFGNMTLTDGYPGSSWADYTGWVTEIVDTNDANANGIPDLSDTFTPPVNQPPTAQLTAPLNGATFLAPANISLSAEASDSDGTVAKVEFFNGAAKLGEDTSAPYSFAFNNVGIGTYTLTAKATDNQGAATTSSPVKIVVNSDATKRIIYSTAFDWAEGYKGYAAGYFLAGQNGWVDLGGGADGVLTNGLPGQGPSAFIGYAAATGSDNTWVWQPVNYTPTPALPVIKFSTLMQVVDSSNGKYDDFCWELWNSQGTMLLGLDFDNNNLHVYYYYDGNTYYQDTQKTFSNTNVYQLLVSLDVPANRWSATLDGQTLVNQLPITTAGSTIDIADFDAVWYIYNTNAPGDNLMMFDNYQISAETKVQAPATMSLVGRPTGGQITLRAQGAANVSFTLQTSSNLSSWTDRQTKNADAQGVVDFTETFSTGTARAFYRVRQN